MKLNTLLQISTILCLILGLVTSSRSKQLFQVINKQLPESPQKKSLFSSSAEPSEETPKKDLFESLNFNQIKEKAVKADTAKASLFSKSGSKTNNKVQVESHKTASKANIKSDSLVQASPLTLDHKVALSGKPGKNEREIKKLRAKFNTLLQTNEKLIKKFENNINSSASKNGSEHEYLNFIEKYDNKVKNLKQNLSDSKESLQKKVNENEEEFMQLYESSSSKIDQIHARLDGVHHQVSQIKEEENKRIRSLQNNFLTQNLSVDNSLNVKGVALIDKVNAKLVDLGSIQLEPKKLTIKDKSILTILGQKSFKAEDMLGNIQTYNALVAKCREDLSKCRPIPENIAEGSRQMEQEILENLRTLRQQVGHIIRNRGESRQR